MESLVLSIDEKGNPYALVVDGKEVLDFRNVDFKTEGEQMLLDWKKENC